MRIVEEGKAQLQGALFPVPAFEGVFILVYILRLDRFVGVFNGKHLCVIWGFVRDGGGKMGIFAPALVHCSTMLFISAEGASCSLCHYILSR